MKNFIKTFKENKIISNSTLLGLIIFVFSLIFGATGNKTSLYIIFDVIFSIIIGVFIYLDLKVFGKFKVEKSFRLKVWIFMSIIAIIISLVGGIINILIYTLGDSTGNTIYPIIRNFIILGISFVVLILSTMAFKNNVENMQKKDKLKLKAFMEINKKTVISIFKVKMVMTFIIMYTICVLFIGVSFIHSNDFQYYFISTALNILLMFIAMAFMELRKIKKPVSKTQTVKKPVSKTQTVKKPVSKTQTVKKPVSKTQTVKKPVSKTQTVKKPVSKTQTVKKPVSKTQTVKKPVSKTQTVKKTVSKTQTVKKSIKK